MTNAVRSAMLRYGLGLASFSLTILISLVLRHYSIRFDLTLLVVVVLIGITWYAGTGPGLMVAFLFEAATVILNPPQALTARVVIALFNVMALLVILVVLVGGRRKGERRLREQREWLQVTLSSIRDAVIATDLKGLVNFMNPAAETLTGWTMSQAANRPLGDVFRAIDEDFNHVVEIPVSDTALPSVTPAGIANDITIVSQGGEKRQIDYSSAPIRNQAGQTTGAVLVFRDITERARLEGQLRQAQKMEAVGRLAGGVAHDFNNLLTAIIGYSQLALNDINHADSLRRDIEEIEKAGRRATTLTKQLLAFSRRQVVQPRTLNLNPIVADIAKMLKRVIGEDIDLVTVLRSQFGNIKADPGQIEQVIINLAVNARDAMPRGGKLIIETADVDLDESYANGHFAVRPGPYVMLAVSDNGMGIDKETQSHIFEPFFTTKEQAKGTGLGLSTVYGIVKQGDGCIWVYSEPGAGTTFKIYLPRVDEPAETPEPSAGIAEPLPGGKTILLVEDDEAVRSLTRQILEMNGHRVLEAGDGSEAIDICERHEGPIHLMITDVVMPGMNCQEVAIRATMFRRELRVLYMSGYTGSAIVHHGVLEANAAFLHKPFTPDALMGKVREIINAQQ